MVVKVRFFSYLREAVGSNVVSISCPSYPCQFREIIQHLVQKHPNLQPYLRPETDVFRQELHVLVNGQSVSEGSGDVLTHPIRDGDEIVILPPIGGGSK